MDFRKVYISNIVGAVIVANLATSPKRRIDRTHEHDIIPQTM